MNNPSKKRRIDLNLVPESQESIVFDKTKRVRINKRNCVLHESILKKYNIFSPLFEEGIDDDKPLEITIPETKYFNEIWDLLTYYKNNTEFLKKVDNATDALALISTITYFSPNDPMPLKTYINIMAHASPNLFGTFGLVKSFTDSFEIFVENVQIKLSAKQIYDLAFALSTKKDVLKHSLRLIADLLCANEDRSIYDCIMVINLSEYKFSNDGEKGYDIRDMVSVLMTSDGRNIAKRKHADAVLKEHFPAKSHTVHFGRLYDNSVIFNKILVDKKAIPLYDHIKTSTPGTSGANTLRSLAMFVAKSLLNLDPYEK